jgi:hypothetical protein
MAKADVGYGKPRNRGRVGGCFLKDKRDPPRPKDYWGYKEWVRKRKSQNCKKLKRVVSPRPLIEQKKNNSKRGVNA